MTLAEITPVVLTWKEAANIERTLGQLRWAEKVLVVDSGSDDETRTIAESFENVSVVERKFDAHAVQWEFGIRHPEVTTDWVLALDADYLLTPEFIEEMARLDLSDGPRGYRARFRYCIDGEPLRRSLYPPVTVLFDRRETRIVQDGHAQRAIVEGPVAELEKQIFHDDRKSPARFLEAQRKYAQLEAEKIRASRFGELSPSGKLRKMRLVAPWLVPLWVLIGRGLLFEGRRGLKYAGQRMLAELMIARELIRRSTTGAVRGTR